MLQAAAVQAPVATNLKAILLLTSSLTVMSGATIAAALPLIETHFASQPNAGLYARLLLTVPALLIAAGSPFAGLFVDRYGRKKLLLASLVLYGLAGSSGAFAGNLFVILVGRVFLGIAVAGIMTTSSALVADYFQGKARQQFLGTQAAAMSLGGVLFISLGGWLATLGWREPFYVYLAALALVPFAYSLVREPIRIQAAPPAPGVKLPGALTGTVLRLYLVIFGGMVMFYLVPVQIPFLLRDLDVSPALAGLAIAAATLSGAVASFNFTRIKSRWSTATIYGVAFLCSGAGFFGIAFAGGYWPVVVSLFVCGLGNGLLMPNTSLAIMAATPEAVRGRVLGGLSTAIFLGQFISPLLAAPVAAGIGLAGVFGYAGVVMVLLALVFVLLGNRLLPESPSPG
jgi:MFS family permease